MKKLTLLLCIFTSLQGYCQNGITFSVEDLSKPEKLLYEQSGKSIYERLIASDVDLWPHKIQKDSIKFPYDIIAQSELPDSLVNYGYHSFFSGMYQAYADHRPFVLSPDMIWLLISQGFARHVNANAENVRHHFVDFSGELSLVVATDKITLENPDSPWEEVFPEFRNQMALHTGNDLMELLSANFSTTTPTTQIASEITIMEAMEPYFEFIVIYIVCGIPEITLQGTTEDWQKVLDKTKQLAKYDLKWWISELEPLLKQFVEASKGKINKTFWRNMFKYHSQKKYGAPNMIDGWIVKFFPYDKNGRRNNLNELEGGKNLPEEIVKVDLKYIDENQEETILELWAGFVGLEQNKENYALTPKIGWMIRKKDVENVGLKQKFESDNKSWGGIAIRVKEIPAAIFELKEIKKLEIAFIDEINIPEKLSEIKIETLRLSGKINDAEMKRIKKMFPDTQLIINRETIE
ncbi:DUF4419 domain-containing protein [uncultured Proteiniphilum sp.]|uniref:DUF4419 domain-containing protein n=1 Tax=uncultured Proteiniphilum sp. TaxID=497637 RepID=UPI0026297F05|nr:DUF4419 domain-containing protein [uncultured Proteiniphilum sp.]